MSKLKTTPWFYTSKGKPVRSGVFKTKAGMHDRVTYWRRYDHELKQWGRCMNTPEDAAAAPLCDTFPDYWQGILK